MGDFADHVTTVFTDVRLKRFLEMRGADAAACRC
jgi:glutamate--cysteine ligase